MYSPPLSEPHILLNLPPKKYHDMLGGILMIKGVTVSLLGEGTGVAGVVRQAVTVALHQDRRACQHVKRLLCFVHLPCIL